MKKFIHEVVIYKKNDFCYPAVWHCKFPSLEIANDCFHNLIDYLQIHHEKNEHLTVALYMDDNLITMEEV